MSASLEDIVAEFIERREAGEELTAEAFAREQGERELEVRTALARLGETEHMFPQEGVLPEVHPDAFGDWVLEEEIGRGGMGRVFRVHRAGEATPGKFALKVLGFSAAADDRAALRIEREGQVLKELEHPGLVKVRDVGRSAHGPWIVMDLVEGVALSTLIARARRDGSRPPVSLGAGEEQPWAAIADLGADVAEALATAHVAGLVHRDVKPSNIILATSGHAVLIDFGLAHAEGTQSLTWTGDVLGTPQYMAPEQARGERAGPHTDLWGLGATLFELCTLRPPTSDRDALAAIERLRSQRPERLTRSRAVPPGLARVIDRALAFKPERRVSDARAFAADLRLVSAGKKPRSTGAGVVERIEDHARAHPRAVWVGLAVLALGGVATVAIESARRARVEAPGEALAEASREGTRAYLARDEGRVRRAAAAMAEAATTDFESTRASILLALGADGELPASSEDLVLGSMIEGCRALEEDRLESALMSFRVAAQRSESWALPLVLLGEVARELDRLDVCEREWTAAVRLGVESPHLYRRLGKVRAKQEDAEGAKSAFQRAVELGGDDWRNHAELARALAGVPEERERALEAAGTAIELSPRPSPVLLNVKAALLDRADRRDEARAIYRELIALDPNDFRSQFNLAYSLDLDCKLSDARVEYEQAAAIRPDSVECQFALAHIAAGAQCETCASCRAAVDDDPELIDPGRVSKHLAAALRADDGSREWLQKAATDLSIAAGNPGELGVVLDEILGGREEVDEWTVRLERARRRLRALER